MNRKQRRIQKSQDNLSDTKAQLQSAIALHQAGQLNHAQSLYEEILQTDPQNFDALHNSGVLAAQTKDSQKALELIGKAIAINPASADAHYNRANLFKELKQWDKAFIDFNQAITLKPNWAEAHYNSGFVLTKLRLLKEALVNYDNAILLQPDYAEAYYSRGNLLKEMRQWDASFASYEKAIALKPAYAEAYCNRGIILIEFGQWNAALASYDQAIAYKSDFAEAYCNRGVILQHLQQWDAALASYNQAIKLNPNYPEAYSNRGVVLQKLKQWNDALISCDKAIMLKPDFSEAYYNRGITLQEMGRLDEAIADYEHTITLKPDHAEAHYNKSLSLLLLGDLLRGWEEYEWRWKEATAVKRNFVQSLWLGNEPLKGKTILLYAEQGLGDAIQFSRYVPMVTALEARVILMVHKQLMSLFTDFPVTQLVADGTVPPPFDCHCPLMSLPLVFKTEPHNIPTSASCLKIDAMKTEQWKAILGKKNKPRIGLVWSGSKAHNNDHNRSIALSDLIKQLSADFQYVSLQKEINDIDKKTLEAHPEILNFSDSLEDFTDTGALCELMDIVISVDTSVAHLSGSLGRPTWILLPFAPDWRWMLEREDSPWYPTVRLFRQPRPGDWKSVTERIVTELELYKSKFVWEN